MKEISFADSLQTGIHNDLQEFTGQWKGSTKVWFGPDQLVDDSAVEGTIRSVLDGRFLLHEYKGSFQGKPLEGIAIFGYDLATNKFQSAWVDSMHMSTGIMFSTADKKDKPFQVLGSYSSGGDAPEIWGWETDMIIRDNQLIITAYNISPTGLSEKATETVYTRV